MMTKVEFTFAFFCATIGGIFASYLGVIIGPALVLIGSAISFLILFFVTGWAMHIESWKVEAVKREKQE